MQLKDYLHYYLYGKIYEVGVGTCQLIGIGDSYYTIKTKQGTLLTLSDRANIKLVLRRLEDMTEEEAITIARLCFFDRDKGYPDSDFKARKVGIGSEKPSTYEVRIDNDWYDEVIKIGFITGNIWRCNGSVEHLHNQSQVFHYRIKQGFDLFGLIDAGLAIDIKTLTP